MTSELSSPRTDTAPGSVRKLQAAQEIAHAFLTAGHAIEVYHTALQNVAPIVGASFACVFLRGDDPALLHVVAAYNWPQTYANYLGSLRVRIGNGPTGQAVALNQLVEAPDVFADSSLEDWWESARELGFASSISLPLVFRGEPGGAITFYFSEPGSFDDADRSLLRLVADQLAATAEKAHLIDDLRRVNERLQSQNVDLEIRCREAQEARRLKNEFLANMSHELRTPLTAILGFANLLSDGMAGPLAEEQLSAVRRIETAGATLLDLITDVLDLTNLKLNRVRVEPELTDAAALARTALLSSEPADCLVELRDETPAAGVPAYVDPVLVLRILRNLISNALKFTTEGTVTIRVRTEQPPADERGNLPGPRVFWEVEDTGIGIAPEDQQAIFDEFRQVDGTATRRFGGTGLGLALSQGLARRLGGEITVRSSPGEGSTFTLALPSSVVRAGSGNDTPQPTDSSETT